MTQEDKELLLKDLCARLPFRVICKFTDTFDGCEVNNILHPDDIRELFRDKLDCKPYLFPLSNMTKEQWKDYINIFYQHDNSWTIETFDWFNRNHFDYRGLIEKGLAIDATNLNIY